MDGYSPDEFLAVFVGLAIGMVSWLRWYYLLAVTGTRVRRQGKRWLLALAPLIGGLLLTFVLLRWSSEDVRTDGDYIIFYLVIGTAWVGIFRLLLPLLGFNPRDEVLERGNDAAAWAVAGALVGGACCFAGGNVGNGPGWWVVLFSAGLSTCCLVLLWVLVHSFSDLAEKVVIERDIAAGLRAGGFFLGAGLMLGRAVAGDWVSASATLTDFARMGWPALVFAGLVAALERCCPPNLASNSNCFASGWLPACVYVGSGAIVSFAWGLP